MEVQRKLDVVARIYATALDAFRQYLDSDEIWEKYWGNSENPPHTPEEFKQKQYDDLINRLNRVPFENEATAKGTAFNELIDAIVENRKPNDMEVSRAYKTYTTTEIANKLSCRQEDLDRLINSDGCNIKYDNGKCCYVDFDEFTGYNVEYNEYKFFFPIDIVRHYKNIYDKAIPQYKASGIMFTMYGRVELYGYIDELMPMSIHDIKTTKNYSSFMFRNHYQHLVYPYCLIQEGMNIHRFDYDVTDFNGVYTETYYFNEERDIPKLREFVEEFLEFLFENKSVITDKKIFNEYEIE